MTGMVSNYDWPFYRPITLDAGALRALEAWRDTLPKDGAPDDEFNAPTWAFAEVEPVWAYEVRGCTCYVYLFRQRQDGASGLVLNADPDWNKAQCIHGDSVQSLAAALSIATMRPRRTRANGRREV